MVVLKHLLGFLSCLKSATKQSKLSGQVPSFVAPKFVPLPEQAVRIVSTTTILKNPIDLFQRKYAKVKATY